MVESKDKEILIGKDKDTWKNIKTGANVVLALLLLICLVLGIWVFGDGIYYNYADQLKKSLIPFVILSTSIVGGAYVFIKLYIENQLEVREDKMIREYERHFNAKLAEQTTEMNQKFAEQTTYMNERFDKQKEEIDRKFKEEVPKIVDLVITKYKELN